jgi:hypothetical protein
MRRGGGGGRRRCLAATVASRWCGMCGYKIVVDYWILLDLDDVFMFVLMAYWIYWNFRWFANKSSQTTGIK